MKQGGYVKEVATGSPVHRAGITSGCIILFVDKQPLRDLIDWRWLTADDSVELLWLDPEGLKHTSVLARKPDEEWGVVFEGVVFDGIYQCCNDCTFCFMKQLPATSRPSLTLRDDDFRLSFLQGTFATFTNIRPQDEARIIEQKLSPLRMSLHAISENIRADLIGKRAKHGLTCCQRLLNAGIELHAQIVLVPGINDGPELEKTLAWAFEQPGIINVGVVPLGFTKHQTDFNHSFNNPAASQAVLNQIIAMQKRAEQERGYPFVYAADEFYRNAYPKNLLEHLPSAQHYGSFDLFEDGIGIIRSFVDDWQSCQPRQKQLSQLLDQKRRRAHLVIGEAQKEFLEPLLAASPLRDTLIPLEVDNNYFGGNVDVTGLLCGCDIVATLKKTTDVSFAAIPSIIFNDEGITLDDMSFEDMQSQISVPLKMVSCNASDYLAELIEYFTD